MVGELEMVVVDASVVLKWQLDDEECVAEAVALRDDFFVKGCIRAVAPHLLIYEVVNGIVSASRRKRLSNAQAGEALSNLLILGIMLTEVPAMKILEVAQKYNLAAYDAAYLALAETENSSLWTGDRAFFQAVKSRTPRVRWIGEYKRNTESK